MSQLNRDDQPPFNRGHVPPASGPFRRPVGTGTYGPGSIAGRRPPESATQPLLSFRPFWRPFRSPGLKTPAEQIQQMIDQRESELVELRALQQTYPLPNPMPVTDPPADPA